MGWDKSFTRYGERLDIANEIRQRYTWEGNEAIRVARGTQSAGITPYYVAVKKDNGEIWAGVCLTRRDRDGLACKSMGEDEGPGWFDAKALPIVEMLTATNSEWANEWREKVRAVAALPKPEKVVSGNLVKFAQPLEFWFGSVSEAIYETGSIFRDTNTGRRLKVSGWRSRGYSVIKSLSNNA